MKYFLHLVLVLFLSIIANQASAQSSTAKPVHSKNNLSGAKLRGKVKLVTTYTYSIKDEFVPARTSKSETHYNKAGNVLKTTYYNDIKSNKISYEMEFLYDAKGSLIKAIRKYEGRTEVVNQRGQLVKSHKSNGPVSSTVVNAMGKRVTESHYDRSKKLRSKVISQYDLRGNLVEAITYGPNGELIKRQTYKYDKRNNKIEETIRKAAGLVGWRRSKYDQYGNPVYIIDSNMSYVGGLPAKKIAEDVYAQTYKYDNLDKHQNWLRQRLLLDGRTAHTVKRKIEYY